MQNEKFGRMLRKPNIGYFKILPEHVSRWSEDLKIPQTEQPVSGLWPRI
jgi:hypothetical protein